jgi:hypothetical protein
MIGRGAAEGLGGRVGAGDRSAMVRELGGTRETARRMGVSQRTVQRWQAGGGMSRQHAAGLTREARASAVRENLPALRRNGATTTVSGRMRPAEYDSPGAWGHRTISVPTSPARTRSIMRAYLAGDDERAGRLISAAMADKPRHGAFAADAPPAFPYVVSSVDWLEIHPG